MIANARQHAAAGATIYITGQPLYDPARPASWRERTVHS
jgi:hypothetical protein